MINLSVEQPQIGAAVSRRGFLRATFGGAGSLAALGQLHDSAQGSGGRRSDTAVIQIWLGGGPSHIDLYDLKPNAPRDFRGPYRPIATEQPGIDVCELLPKHAGIMPHLSVIRSLHHSSNDHVAGTHWMQTGYFGATTPKPDQTHPSAGSIIAETQSADRSKVLPYVHVLPELPIETYSQQFRAAYLKSAYNPFEIRMPFPGYNASEHFEARDLSTVAGLDLDRMDRRLSLRQQFDRTLRAAETADAHSADYRRAYDLLSSQPIRRAFDLAEEKPAVRARYGSSGWGQAALLCRRLVEAGATFVTLNTDSSSNMWDNHVGIEKYFRIMLPAYDAMLSALVGDLVERGLYDRVVVLVWGEFGRTPRINDKAGRDHWGSAGCALTGGGGLRVGQVIGATTSKGEEPSQRPIRPGDVLATLYELVGVDPARQFTNHAGRPVPVLTDGEPIAELMP